MTPEERQMISGLFERVRQAAWALVTQRYLLAEDVEISVAAAGRLWDYFAAPRS